MRTRTKDERHNHVSGHPLLAARLLTGLVDDTEYTKTTPRRCTCHGLTNPAECRLLLLLQLHLRNPIHPLRHVDHTTAGSSRSPHVQCGVTPYCQRLKPPGNNFAYGPQCLGIAMLTSFFHR